ncbi:molybdenum cofactor guanylyltransferase [uncultured Shewanella sp.]|uniref:molybdenum cofactor guanylyltransferase n=1 Tax=uncultured Shewanella sp. TaxID=173975 RepID=UPI0026036E5C|nr:molybdenum cofactor guanylyltransferase [uncultured Shewanella sp.]
MNKDNILGVILAGGQSQRMGKDKAKLQINGVSMLQRNRHLLGECGIQNIVVCRNQTGYLADIHLDCGPMGAIHTALFFAQKREDIEGLMIIPIDMPLLNKKLINQLIDYDTNNVLQEKTSEGKRDCARYFQSTPLPLFLPNDPSFLPLSEAVATSKKNRSIKAFLALIDSESIISRHPEKLINTNDKTQWQHAIDTISDIH